MTEVQSAVVRTSRAVQTPRERRCEQCGSLLRGKRSQLYCDATCRSTAYRRRKGETARVIVRRLKNDIAELEKMVGMN